MRDKRSFG